MKHQKPTGFTGQYIRTLQQRCLSLSEICQGARTVFRRNLRSEMILLFLVYGPVCLIRVNALMHLDLTYYDTLFIVRQMELYLVLVMILSLLELVCRLVMVQICQNEYKNSAAEFTNPLRRSTFSVLFYRGVRMWPRAALTQCLIITGTVLLLMMTAVFMQSPAAAAAGIVLFAVIVVYEELISSLCAGTSALYGEFGFRSLSMLSVLLKGKAFVRSMLTVLALETGNVFLSLLIAGLTYLLALASLSYMVRFLIVFAISLAACVYTVYVNTAEALLFLNLDLCQKKR